MAKQQWLTDKWFVSQFNFAKKAHIPLPKKILFHDTTLRDGEQQPTVVFTKEDKIRIARILDEVGGIERIEAGMPAVSKEDEEAVKAIANLGLDSKVMCFSRCLVSDAELARKSDVWGVVMELPSSSHLIKYAYNWSEEEAIKRATSATSYAKEHGLFVVFFCIDATRADISFLTRLFGAVEADTDAFCIADTFGACNPQGIEYLIRALKKSVKKPLEIHCHDDFGLAVANSIAALSAGAEVAHTTVNGIGERTGNASFEEVALSLRLLYGYDIEMNWEKIYDLSKLVEKLSRIKVPPQKAIVGENAFRFESGIIVDWWYKLDEAGQPLEMLPFMWDFVGQKRVRTVLGKKSGKTTILKRLEKLGVKATDETILELLDEVKRISVGKKGPLTNNEFKTLLKERGLIS